MPEAVAVTHDGRFVVDGVGVVLRDPATGALSPTGANCVVGDDMATSHDEPSRDCRVDRRLGRPLGMDLTAGGRYVVVGAAEGTTLLRRARATGGLRQLEGRATCATVDGTDGPGFGKYKRPEECLDGDYALGTMTGIELSPDNRHAYMLETEAGFGRAAGVVQVLRRR